MNPKNVQEAIKIALIENGPMTHNRLYKNVNRTRTCSNKTFVKHLLILVEQGSLHRKESGQYVEYSVSKSEKKMISKSSELISKLKNDSKNEFPKIIKFLKKQQNSSRYSKIKPEQKIKLFFTCLDSVNIILSWSKVLVLMTKADFSTIENKRQAMELQKAYFQQLQELFWEIRRIDRVLSLEIFSTILDETKPQLGKLILNKH